MVTRGSAAFVGRHRELQQLDRALESTAGGAGATVLLAGEAGIGKTRLASEVAARAGERGFEVLLGRSIDLVGTELPYLPFLEALRPFGQLPQIDSGAAGSQLRMFQDTLALLSDHTAAGPVLLMLEDVHWADASTLDLLLFFAYNVADPGALLLATYRPDERPLGRKDGRFADGGSAYRPGLRARAGTARARRGDGARGGALRRPGDHRTDRGDRRSLRRQPILRRGAPHCRTR